VAFDIIWFVFLMQHSTLSEMGQHDGMLDEAERCGTEKGRIGFDVGLLTCEMRDVEG
jgi:hypothetical protein